MHGNSRSDYEEFICLQYVITKELENIVTFSYLFQTLSI